jgi:hypothetical protein
MLNFVKQYKYYIILILILITILLLIIIFKTYEFYKNSNDYNYFIRLDCKYIQSKTLLDIIKETQDNFYYNLYLPCIYEDIEEEYEKFNRDKNGVYFLIDNIDIMVGKDYLYKNVFNKYGRDKTITLMPESWILNDPKDFERFKKEFNRNKIYVMKKNVQRQNGITISNNLDEIIKNKENDEKNDYPFVIVQDLLQDPYTISGRKINLRVYVLIIKNSNKTNLYVYSDGFMYYTAELFKKNSIDKKINITTGYIDRKVYEENPLTHNDFKLYLDSDRNYNEIEQNLKNYNKNISEYVFNNIYNLITDIFTVFFDKIGKSPKLYNNTKFQLFGCDVAIDENLDAKIMEINKGPDLGAKDKRDSELKHNLVRDIFKTVGLINNDDANAFIQLV